MIHPGETLPKGATETGTWAVESTAAATGESVGAVISFPIRLAEGILEGHTDFVAVGESTSSGTLAEQCEGDVENPGAKSGRLCVFEGETLAIHHGGLQYGGSFVSPDGGLFGGPTGGQLIFSTTQTGRVSAEGTWAVTGA